MPYRVRRKYLPYFKSVTCVKASGNGSWTLIISYLFFRIELVRIMVWTHAYIAFTVETCFKTSESVIAFPAHLCFVGLMLFQIENWYCYWLKISGREFHWLKESHLGDLKTRKPQKMTRTLLCNLRCVWPINMLQLWDYHIYPTDPLGRIWHKVNF